MTFLEQLQESAGLLGNQIQNVNPFGNYNPTLASDYVGGPMGLIAQNRFVGNQFQMPFPGGQSYTPGAMAPGGYNPLPYTPLPFNQGNVSTTQPGLLTQIEQAVSGGRGDGAFGGRDGQSTMGIESVNGMGFQINPVTGAIKMLDEGSIANNLATDISNLQNLTPSGLLGAAIGGLTNSSDYGRQLDRIESQYGKAVADEIAATVRESYGPGKARPQGFLTVGRVLDLQGNMVPAYPGTKTEIGGIRGFINSQGNFQRGTPIGEINKPAPAPTTLTPKKGGGYNQSSGTTRPGGTIGSGSQPQGPRGGGGRGDGNQGGGATGPGGGIGGPAGGPGSGRGRFA